MPNCNRAANSHPLPQFRGVLVEPHFWDSYWTESFDVNNDGRVDVFSSGLFSGEVILQVLKFDNLDLLV